MKLGLFCLGVIAVSTSSVSATAFASKQILYGFDNAAHLNVRSGNTFYIQAGSFKQKANAIRCQQSLQSKTPYQVGLVAKRGFVSVLIGPIPTVAELRKTAASIQHTQRTSLKAKPQQTLAIKIPPSKERPSTARWFVSLGSGASFPQSHGTMYVDNNSGFAYPLNFDSYSSNQHAGALINLAAGKRWEAQNQWGSSYSLGLMYQHQFNATINGLVTQNLLPQFENYNYNWRISSDIVLATAKVNVYSYKPFSPYLAGGLGAAFNHTNYSEVPLPGVTPRISPDFSSNQSQFAYNAGAGMDYRLSDNMFITAAYFYQNLGAIRSPGKASWAQTSLDLGHYGTNEALIGVTYLMN